MVSSFSQPTFLIERWRVFFLRSLRPPTLSGLILGGLCLARLMVQPGDCWLMPTRVQLAPREGIIGSEAGRRAACRSVGKRPGPKEGAGHNARKKTCFT